MRRILQLHKDTLRVLELSDLEVPMGGGETADCRTRECPPITRVDCPKSVPACDSIRFCRVESLGDL